MASAKSLFLAVCVVFALVLIVSAEAPSSGGQQKKTIGSDDRTTIHVDKAKDKGFRQEDLSLPPFHVPSHVPIPRPVPKPIVKPRHPPHVPSPPPPSLPHHCRHGCCQRLPNGVCYRCCKQ